MALAKLGGSRAVHHELKHRIGHISLSVHARLCLAAPNLGWVSRTSTYGGTFDTITNTQNSPNSMREIQAALKFIFY